MSPYVAIRTRASLGYGWGHLMRARRLRDHFRRIRPDVRVALVVEGDEGVRAARSAWNEDWHELDEGVSIEQEFEWTRALAPRVVVADLLEIEAGRLACWRGSDRMAVVFDDLARGTFDADIVVRPQMQGKTQVAPGAARVLEGPDYFIVDSALCEGEGGARRRVENVLVVMGGCLPPRVAGWTRSLLGELAKSPFTTTVLTGFDGAASLEDLALGDRVSILAGERDVARPMRTADLAIAASGYVKFELAAAGTPALLVAIVNHQEELGRRFAERTGAARYLGTIERVDAAAITGAIAELATDRETREAMARAGRRVVDGRGAERVAAAILGAFETRERRAS